MVNSKSLLTSIFLSIGIAFSKPVHGESFYSVASLTLLCSSESHRNEEACIAYLHGIFETWMLKDVVSVDPYRYQNSGRGPTFCETINKVSDQEWLRIVRRSLETMDSGFAADAVMTILSQELCE